MSQVVRRRYPLLIGTLVVILVLGGLPSVQAPGSDPGSIFTLPVAPGPALSGNITNDTVLADGTFALVGNVSVVGANLTLRNATLVLDGSAYLAVLANGSLTLEDAIIRGNGTRPTLAVAGDLTVANASIDQVASVTANASVSIAALTVTGATLTLNASGDAMDVTVANATLGIDIRGRGNLTLTDVTLLNVTQGLAIGTPGSFDISGTPTLDGLPFWIRSGLKDTLITGPLASGLVSDQGTLVLYDPENVTIADTTWTGDAGVPLIRVVDPLPGGLTLRNVSLADGGSPSLASDLALAPQVIFAGLTLENTTGAHALDIGLGVANPGGITVDGVPVRLITDTDGYLLDSEVVGGLGHTSWGDLIILRSTNVIITGGVLSGAPEALWAIDSDLSITGTSITGRMEVRRGTLTTTGISLLGTGARVTDALWSETGSTLGTNDGGSSLTIDGTEVHMDATTIRAHVDANASVLTFQDLVTAPTADLTFPSSSVNWTWTTGFYPADPNGSAVVGDVELSIDGGNRTPHTAAEVVPGARLLASGAWDNASLQAFASNHTHRGIWTGMVDGDTPIPIILATIDTIPPVIDASAYPSRTDAPLSCTTFTTAGISDDLWLDDVHYLVIDEGAEVVNASAPLTHCWSSYGVHQVTLVATDGAGNQATHLFIIDVPDTQSPVPIIDLPSSALPNLPFTISGNRSGDNDRVVNWSWEFIGFEPHFAYGPEQTVTIADPGTYRVRLLVRDPAERTGFIQVDLTVEDITPPVPAFTLPPSIDFGDIVTLDARNSTDDGAIISYLWSVGPDPPRTYSGKVIQVPFDRIGYANVTLTVTDSAGNNASLTRVVLIRDLIPPIARAGLDQVLQAGQEALFDGSGSTDDDRVVAWRWTFTDGSGMQNLTGERIFHRFPISGNWSVVLTVEDAAGNQGTDSLWVNVTERQDPIARFPPNEDGSPRTNALATVGEVFSISGTSSTDDQGIVNYTWTLISQGDTSLRWGPVFTWRPNATEDAVLYLDVFDAENRTDRAQLTISVREPPGGSDGGDGGGPKGAELTWLVLGILGGGAIVAGIIMLVVRDLRRQRRRRGRRGPKVAAGAGSDPKGVTRAGAAPGAQEVSGPEAALEGPGDSVGADEGGGPEADADAGSDPRTTT